MYFTKPDGPDTPDVYALKPEDPKDLADYVKERNEKAVADYKKEIDVYNTTAIKEEREKGTKKLLTLKEYS